LASAEMTGQKCSKVSPDRPLHEKTFREPS
jgi:hypothetical protein